MVECVCWRCYLSYVYPTYIHIHIHTRTHTHEAAHSLLIYTYTHTHTHEPPSLSPYIHTRTHVKLFSSPCEPLAVAKYSLCYHIGSMEIVPSRPLNASLYWRIYGELGGLGGICGDWGDWRDWWGIGGVCLYIYVYVNNV